MTRNIWSTSLVLFLLAAGSLGQSATAADTKDAAAVPAPAVEFFQAIDDHQVDVKFIAKNDHEARLLIKNNTAQPINLKLPEAFAGVPALAQFGGGGGGGNRGGGGGGNTGGGQQSVGGGIGGGGGGQQGGGGGGGGFFSVPPEQTAKIDVAVVCLDHGLRDPNSAADYKIVPAEDFLDRPAVVELLKAYGRGELKQGAVQAAAWHLNNDLSWDQLATKLQGTRRSTRRPPYFTQDEIRTGMAYAAQATQLAETNADEYERAKKVRNRKKAEAESRAERSAEDSDAKIN